MAINNVSSVNQVQQTQLQNALEALQTSPELSPLLGGKSVTVSQAPLDLDSLVAKLGNELTNKQEDIAKHQMSSVFKTVIARAQQTLEANEQNQTYLNDASTLNQQLAEYEQQISTLNKEIKQTNQQIGIYENRVHQAEITVNTMQGKVDKLQQKVDALQQEADDLLEQMNLVTADINGLEADLALATDPQVQAEIEAQIVAKTDQLTQYHQLLEDVDTRIDAAKEKLGEGQQSLTEAQNALSEAQTTLDNAKTTLASKKAELQTAIASKDDLTSQITDKLSNLVNLGRLFAEIDKMADDADDVNEVNQDLVKERGEDEEKYLDEHDPLRIIQNAVARHDLDILDTIATKREEKV